MAVLALLSSVILFLGAAARGLEYVDVDPASHLYAQGIRPRGVLLEFGGRAVPPSLRLEPFH
jgi:hypothetical protein